MTIADFASDNRLRPLTAMRAVRRLFADPDDTRQIFVIFRALRGRSGLKAFTRFAATKTGETILREGRALLPRLEDRAAMAALPEGSVGRAYLAFMELENLSAAGLVSASQDWEGQTVSSDVQLYRERMRDSHDLTHILTGYGRDGLGELCLLAFMHRHSHNLGQGLIVAMSWPQLSGAARRAVRQAWWNGAKAEWIPALDFEALLARPLEDVRRELGFAVPTTYQAIVS